jgi:hypothetical protein
LLQINPVQPRLDLNHSLELKLQLQVKHNLNYNLEPLKVKLQLSTQIKSAKLSCML